MRKQCSPVFSAVVIVIAIALGALYFMYRYRAHEAAWHAESAALQAAADNARRAGRSDGGAAAMMQAGRRPGPGMMGEMGRGRAIPGGPAAPKAAQPKAARSAGAKESGK